MADERWFHMMGRLYVLRRAPNGSRDLEGAEGGICLTEAQWAEYCRRQARHCKLCRASMLDDHDARLVCELCLVAIAPTPWTVDEILAREG